MFLEHRGLKTTIYKAASLKVVLRLQPLPGNSSRMESMTAQYVSELLQEIQESEFCMLLVTHKQLKLPVPCPLPTNAKQVSNAIKN